MEHVIANYNNCEYEYEVAKAPCSSTSHIKEWLNTLGLQGWVMCGRISSRTSRREESSPTFYFVRLKQVDVEVENKGNEKY